MKSLILSIALLSSCAVVTFAEVIPWSVITGRGVGAIGPAYYDVPAGKVFILERVQHRSNGGTPYIEGQDFSVSISQKPANHTSRLTSFISFDGGFVTHKMYWFDGPIMLTAGDRLNSNRTSGYYHWYGKLVDVGDLFADLEVDLKDSNIEGGKLKAVAEVSPTRPYRLDVESATTLSNFSADPNPTVTSTDKSTEKVVAVDLDTSPTPNTKFLRAKAVARPMW